MKNQIMPCTVPTWAVMVDDTDDSVFYIPIVAWRIDDLGDLDGLTVQWDCTSEVISKSLQFREYTHVEGTNSLSVTGPQKEHSNQ